MTTQLLSQTGYMAKWLSVRLRTKWLWAQVQLCEICSKFSKSFFRRHFRTVINEVIEIVLVSLLITLNKFHTLFSCFH